jgi:malic enzyme
MFTVAAETLASMVEADDLNAHALYPQLRRLRPITRRIAVEVALEACAQNLCDRFDRDEATRRVAEWMWEPTYPRIVPA